MSRSELRKSAEAFAKDQMEITRAHGTEPRLSKKEITGLVRAAECTLASISGAKELKAKAR